MFANQRGGSLSNRITDTAVHMAATYAQQYMNIYIYIHVWTLGMFAKQRGGALQVGFQTRLATWPERKRNNT